MFCVVFLVRKAIFIFVSWKLFFNFLDFLLLNIKVAHFDFSCCEFVYFLSVGEVFFYLDGVTLVMFLIVFLCVSSYWISVQSI
jgi:hypothetical protein